MQEYEDLINWDESEPIVFEIDSLSQLSGVLIQARIAAKVSQKELPERLEIEESLLQRYEDRQYESMTMMQLIEISEVLEILIQSKTTIRVVAPLKIA